MTKQPSLTRICTACGIEKPLAAFLQLSGSLGTHYGAICASCRATGKTQPSPITRSEEDSTTVTTDKRIGSKEKVFVEQEKKRYFKDRKESDLKDAQRREEQTKEKTEKESIRKEAEKDHRKFYLDTKQIPTHLAPKLPDQTQETPEKKAQQPLEKLFIENKKELQRQEDIIKQEFQTTSLDFSKPFISGQTNQLRFQSDTFLKFKSWIGGSSPIVQMLENLYRQTTAKNTSTNQSKTSAKENIEQYIDKRIDPSSTRKR